MSVDMVLTVTYFAFLLGFGVLIANLTKKIRIPDAFLLLILGLILGPTIFQNPAVAEVVNITLVDVSAMGAVPDFLRILALIMIVFTGTFKLSMRTFKKYYTSSIKLAVIGVLFNTVLFGFAMQIIFGIGWVYSFLIGAILSGTGTGVVQAMEGSVDAKEALNILKIESIFNSPLTILLPALFLDLVMQQPGVLLMPMKYVTLFGQLVATGVGIGILIGFATGRFLKGMLKEYTPLFMLAVALITYGIAENLGGSGMLAVAVAGLLIGNSITKETEKEEIKHFEDYMSEMLRISVFTLLGAQIFFTLTMQQFIWAVVFFLIIFFSRPIILLPGLGNLRENLTKKDVLFLCFVAPRGLASAAIVPIAATIIISIGLASMAHFMMNIVFTVIMLSMLASTIAAVLFSDRLEREESSSEEERPISEYKEIETPKKKSKKKPLKKVSSKKKKTKKKSKKKSKKSKKK